MFRVLIADDSFEDREILKLEIQKALKDEEPEIRFYEAASVKKALERLKVQSFDLMTLDIEFDRMNEGLEVLPEIFESYPTLNVIVISGKLNKSEVSGSLFRFTKDNVLKGKRWARHFDVLDKKDGKAEALRDAYHFALKRHDKADRVRDLFLIAESYLGKGEIEHCLDVYRKIQELAPEDEESNENISIVKGAAYEKALEYLRKGETVVAGLLLGYHIENRLKRFTKRTLGRDWPGLFECVKELERSRKFSPYKKELFHKLIRIRNKSIHHPNTINEGVFDEVQKDLKLLEGGF